MVLALYGIAGVDCTVLLFCGTISSPCVSVLYRYS